MITEIKFKEIYEKCVEEIFDRVDLERVQKLMATHNAGWSGDCFKIKDYYYYAWKDYWNAYKMIANTHSADKNVTICDIGGFFGIFCLVMSRLGYQLTMTETLKYYSGAFDELYVYLSENNIDIIDYDIFEVHDQDDLNKRFDYVTAIAVVEHYPYSLKTFFDNCKMLCKKNGYICLLTPNITRVVNRISFMLGNTVLSNISEIWNSAVPYTGHCHEFTMYELEALGKVADLDVVCEETYNNKNSSFSLFYQFVRKVGALKKDMRDINVIMYRKSKE